MASDRPQAAKPSVTAAAKLKEAANRTSKRQQRKLERKKLLAAKKASKAKTPCSSAGEVQHKPAAVNVAEPAALNGVPKAAKKHNNGKTLVSTPAAGAGAEQHSSHKKPNTAAASAAGVTQQLPGHPSGMVRKQKHRSQASTAAIEAPQSAEFVHASPSPAQADGNMQRKHKAQKPEADAVAPRAAGTAAPSASGASVKHESKRKMKQLAAPTTAAIDTEPPAAADGDRKLKNKKRRLKAPEAAGAASQASHAPLRAGAASKPLKHSKPEHTNASANRPAGATARNTGSLVADSGKQHKLNRKGAAGAAVKLDTSTAGAGKKRKREATGGAAADPTAAAPIKKAMADHPFEADYCDHFETPLKAYQDVAAVLRLLARHLGKQQKDLRIWDPYYCEGRVKQHLATLGFNSVHNENADFYRVIEDGAEPEHDVIITNPPYSEDHKQRCLEYVASSGKPWLVLVPNYIANKEYYKRAAVYSQKVHPFYVVPRMRYEFDHPEGTGHETSPFVGMWYIHLGSHTDNIFNEVTKAPKSTQPKGKAKAAAVRPSDVRFVRTVEELALEALVPTAKRGNPRSRKKAAAKRAAQGAPR